MIDNHTFDADAEGSGAAVELHAARLRLDATEAERAALQTELASVRGRLHDALEVLQGALGERSVLLRHNRDLQAQLEAALQSSPARGVRAATLDASTAVPPTPERRLRQELALAQVGWERGCRLQLHAKQARKVAWLGPPLTALPAPSTTLAGPAARAARGAAGLGGGARGAAGGGGGGAAAPAAGPGRGTHAGQLRPGAVWTGRWDEDGAERRLSTEQRYPKPFTPTPPSALPCSARQTPQQTAPHTGAPWQRCCSARRCCPTHPPRPPAWAPHSAAPLAAAPPPHSRRCGGLPPAAAAAAAPPVQA